MKRKSSNNIWNEINNNELDLLFEFVVCLIYGCLGKDTLQLFG